MLKIHLHSGLDYGIEQHVAELVTLYIKQLLFLQMRQHECGHQQRECIKLSLKVKPLQKKT